MRALLIISISLAGMALAEGFNPPDPAAGLSKPGWMDPKYADEADISAEMGEQAQESSGGSQAQVSAPRQSISETAQALLMQQTANQLSNSFKEMVKNPLKKSSRQNLNKKTVQAGKADQKMHEALRSGQFDNSLYKQVYTQATEIVTGIKLRSDSTQKARTKEAPSGRIPVAITQNNKNKNINANVIVIETINLGKKEIPIEVDQTEFVALSQKSRFALGLNANYAKDTFSEGKQKLAKLETKQSKKQKIANPLAANAPNVSTEKNKEQEEADTATSKREKKAPNVNLEATSGAETNEDVLPVGSIEHAVPLRLLAGKLKSEEPAKTGFEFIDRKPAKAVLRKISSLSNYHAALELKGAWPFWLLFFFLGGAGVLLIKQRHHSAVPKRERENDSDEEVTAVTKTDTDIQDIA